MIVFVRYIANGRHEEKLLMCVALSGTCTGGNIFSAVDTRLHNFGLSWECCISTCTDEAWGYGRKTQRLFRKSVTNCSSYQFYALLNFILLFIERILLAKHWTNN